MTDFKNTPKLSESTEPAISYSTCYKQPFRVLNCYAGIGGNRKLWNGPNMQVTAIEYDENIAKVYQDLYPNDIVIVADAHEYLLNNCVAPEIGLAIFESALNIYNHSQNNQIGLFTQLG